VPEREEKKKEQADQRLKQEISDPGGVAFDKGKSYA